MALGIALIVGWRLKLSATVSLLMMLFFTFLTYYSWYFDAVQDCGCFGDAIKLTPYQSFMKDIILTIALLPILAYAFLTQEGRQEKNTPLQGILSIGSFVLFGAFSVWCYQHLPPIDFRPYRIGADMYECTTPLPENDFEPHCHDYAPIGMVCGEGDMYAEFHGSVLIIVSNNLKDADEDDVTAAVELANALTQPGDPKVFGFTATGTDDLAEVTSQFNIPFCQAQGDQTVTKTIIRSNPGYLLLKDGIVIDKWHHNDIPTAEDIRKTLN